MFVVSVRSVGAVPCKRWLVMLWQALDKNQDGWITREELELVEGLTSAEIDQIMAEADTNADGKIGIDEFIAWR